MRRARLGIRQSLFFVLLAIVVAMTSLFLLLAAFTVNRQIGRTSVEEMGRSRDTFQALEQQRQDLLLRQTALLSELPSLKALMTTNDQPTIVDAGKAFWQTSGSDLFALMGPDGSLLALPKAPAPASPRARSSIAPPGSCSPTDRRPASSSPRWTARYGDGTVSSAPPAASP